MAINDKVITLWPAYLRQRQIQSEATARAEVPRHLSGYNRWLYEFARGESAEPGGSARVHRNPQGTVGHDHSGPPYGVAMLHNVATFSGCQQLPNLVKDDYKTHLAYASANGGPLVVDVDFWCRPFVEWDGAPYSRAYFALWVESASGTQTVWVNAWVRGDQYGTQTATETVTSSSSGATLLSTGYLPCSPGWNKYSVKLDNRTGGVVDVRLLALSFYQKARISH